MQRKTGSYMPEYAPGEVVVFFKENLSRPLSSMKPGHALSAVLPEVPDDSIAAVLAGLLGYTPLGPWDYGGGYRFRVPAGEEGIAIRRFARCRNIVDSAERVDMKEARRWNDLDALVTAVEDLRDYSPTLPDRDYLARAKDLAKKLGSLKP